TVLGLAYARYITRCSFWGISLGGMVGQWRGANAPCRCTALALACTSPRLGSPANWDARRRAVQDGGMAAIVDAAMQRFFTPETLERRDPHAASVRRALLGASPVGYAGCCAAVRDMDHVELLRRIAAPTLVIVGDRDVSTPW